MSLTNLHELLFVQGAAAVKIRVLKDLPQKFQLMEQLPLHPSILQFLITLCNVQSVLHYDTYNDVQQSEGCEKDEQKKQSKDHWLALHQWTSDGHIP
eukprot:Skav231233  [mRNA]  locus=scaffold813:262503:264539:- [translate_table: standard]